MPSIGPANASLRWRPRWRWIRDEITAAAVDQPHCVILEGEAEEISSLVASQTTSQLLWKFSFDWLRREMNWFHSGCLCVSLFCRRDKFDKKHQSGWAECPSPHPTNPFPPRAPLRRNLQMSLGFTNWVTWHMCVWFLWKTFWVFWAPGVGTESPYELMVNVTSPLLPAYMATQVGGKCQNHKRNTHVVVLQLLKNLYLHHQRSNDQWDSASLGFSVEAQWPRSCCRMATTIRWQNESRICRPVGSTVGKKFWTCFTVQSPPLAAA